MVPAAGLLPSAPAARMMKVADQAPSEGCRAVCPSVPATPAARSKGARGKGGGLTNADAGHDRSLMMMQILAKGKACCSSAENSI